MQLLGLAQALGMVRVVVAWAAVAAALGDAGRLEAGPPSPARAFVLYDVCNSTLRRAVVEGAVAKGQEFE